ncbi:MAG TPA: cupredoxin domain-containing protein [Acidimicrobiales bacterium]|nr:cupredoxin domain-containing protein [Acidimicrobiales bacterium]
MRRLVTLAAVFALFLVGCGRGQDPALNGGKATGKPKTELTVVAKNTAFEPTTLTAAAAKALTITFRNEDTIQHSFHLFGGTAGDIKTEIKAGPSTEDVHVTLNVPTSYSFQCDVHPGVMKGTIVVIKEKAS